MQLTRPTAHDWTTPATYWPGLDAATAQLDPPFGVISLPALAHNAFSMLDRVGSKPIRVASKSVRVRSVLDAVLALPGYAGVLAYTLPEALWLASTIPDVVVGYPTADRAAIRQLATDSLLAARVTLMVDSIEQLDFIDSVIPPDQRETIRVCLELEVSYQGRFVGYIGVRRSPIHSPEQAENFAVSIINRPGFRLVGVMGYEAQVAGVTNVLPGNPVRGAIIRGMQRSSVTELAERRGAAVAAVRNVVDLEFVNGGGTGSLESTAADESVTEVAAGSGLFGPHLFDHYGHFTPAPAASFALSVVRRPTAQIATVMGGGWIASGPYGPDRAPLAVWPEGLTLLGREGAGEVQTPYTGAAASTMRVGDRVWLRHTKAGEISEHLNEFAIVDGGAVVETVPTYRGEGMAFL